MDLLTILNHCYRHRGFVYQRARFSADRKSIEIDMRPRERSAAICSGCRKPAPGYDHLPERRFEFIPLWGFLIFLLYRMRRVQCRTCGVVVEVVPWSDGKHQLTKAYMLFLARWARKLSWKETAEAFHTSWEKVCDAVEYVVQFGLEHRKLEPIRAIGLPSGREPCLGAAQSGPVGWPQRPEHHAESGPLLIVMRSRPRSVRFSPPINPVNVVLMPRQE